MSRQEFIQKLRELLNDIPESEREEAVGFYEDYLDEAGTENEERILRELESPEKLAQIIKDGLAEKSGETGEFGETGYHDSRYENKDELLEKTKTVNNSGDSYRECHSHANREKNQNNTAQNSTKQTSTGKIILIIALCVIASPIVLPMIIAIISVFFSMIIALVAIVFGLCVAAVVLFGVGIVLFLAGMSKLLVAPFAALCMAGAGLVISALSMIGITLLIMAAAVVVPALCRGFVALCRMPFRRRETA